MIGKLKILVCLTDCTVASFLSNSVFEFLLLIVL
jgi:hypothetical protein